MEGESNSLDVFGIDLFIKDEKEVGKIMDWYTSNQPHPTPLTAPSTCDHMLQGHSEADGHVCCKEWCIISGQADDAGAGETAPPPLTPSMHGLPLMCREPVCCTTALWGWITTISIVTIATMCFRSETAIITM